MTTQKTNKITKLAEKALKEKKAELEELLSRKPKKAEEIHFAQSKMQLEEVTITLDSCEVMEFSQDSPALVIIGSRVTLENLRNGDRREYVILTRSTADPLKGVISNESPLAQKMMGLKLGNTFKFKDLAGIEESYKIITIE
jgi:transcription elongation GreA/GreB family factor